MNSILSWFSEFRAYVYGAVSLLIGVLIAAVRHFYRKSQKQRKAKERSERSLEAERERREQELDLRDTQNRAERRRKENERAEKKRIDNDVRPEHWSDRRIRLRKKD